MTCPACAASGAWRDFWQVIVPLISAAHSPSVASSDSEAVPAPSLVTPTSEVLIASFIEYLEARRRAAGTIRQRVRHIRALVEEHDELATVTPEQLEAWVRTKSAGKAAATANTYVKSLRVFYGWADRFGLVRPNPAILLDLVANPHRAGRIVDDEQLSEVVQSARPELRAMLLLGRLGGLRLTEIATLHSSARSGDWLTIVGKGSRQRRIFVVPELARALDAIEPRAGGYYFPGRAGGRGGLGADAAEQTHMHPVSINKIITREAGCNPHALRHAAATAAYRESKDLRAVQAFLGHSSPATTSIYVHVGDESLQAAAQAAARAVATRLPL